MYNTNTFNKKTSFIAEMLLIPCLLSQIYQAEYDTHWFTSPYQLFTNMVGGGGGVQPVIQRSGQKGISAHVAMPARYREAFISWKLSTLNSKAPWALGAPTSYSPIGTE